MSKKAFLKLTVPIMALFFSIGIDVLGQTTTTPASGNFVSGYGVQRYEEEQKLQIPLDKEGEVWDFMVKHLVNDPSTVKAIDPLLSVSGPQEENFIDTYYDTPILGALAQETGVRYRRRENVVSGAGKEEMQVKTSNIEAHNIDPALRGTIKFKTNPVGSRINVSSTDDINPLLKIVQSSDRQAFKDYLGKLGLDPYIMKPILYLPDDRKRIYVIYNNESVPIISISFDHVKASLWWAKKEFVEIEPELRQTVGLDDPKRVFYAQVDKKIMDEIKNQFPFITTDTIPKYNKVFSGFEKQIPLLRLYIRYGENLIVVFIAALVAVGAGIYFLIRKIRNKQKSA